MRTLPHLTPIDRSWDYRLPEDDRLPRDDGFWDAGDDLDILLDLAAEALRIDT